MDRYARAVEYLLGHPSEIERAWFGPDKYEHGCLFQFCNPSGEADENRPDGKPCGCLTMVRSNKVYGHAWTDALTEAIRADTRLPALSPGVGDPWDRTVLEAMADWQRRLDYAIRGKPQLVNNG